LHDQTSSFPIHLRLRERPREDTIEGGRLQMPRRGKPLAIEVTSVARREVWITWQHQMTEEERHALEEGEAVQSVSLDEVESLEVVQHGQPRDAHA
jgi:hypothetical protein